MIDTMLNRVETRPMKRLGTASMMLLESATPPTPRAVPPTS